MMAFTLAALPYFPPVSSRNDLSASRWVKHSSSFFFFFFFKNYPDFIIAVLDSFHKREYYEIISTNYFKIQIYALYTWLYYNFAILYFPGKINRSGYPWFDKNREERKNSITEKEWKRKGEELRGKSSETKLQRIQSVFSQLFTGREPMHSQRSSFINFIFMSTGEAWDENSAKNKASIF